MNTKDFLRLGVPLGEATRRAAERMKQAEKYLDRDEPRVAEQIQQEASTTSNRHSVNWRSNAARLKRVK